MKEYIKESWYIIKNSCIYIFIFFILDKISPVTTKHLIIILGALVLAKVEYYGDKNK